MAGQPLIVIAADDESTRSRLGADLSRRFGADYRLLCVGFDEAPGVLDGLADCEERVAAVIAEPMSNAGVEFLAGVRQQASGYAFCGDRGPLGQPMPPTAGHLVSVEHPVPVLSR